MLILTVLVVAVVLVASWGLMSEAEPSYERRRRRRGVASTARPAAVIGRDRPAVLGSGLGIGLAGRQRVASRTTLAQAYRGA